MTPFHRYVAHVGKPVGASALLVLSAALAACGGGSLDPILGLPGATLAPAVSATVPVASVPVVTNVDTHVRVSATFNKPMLATSITNTSFTLACPSAAPVAATVAYDASTRVATLTPTAALPPTTDCVATVSTAVMDTTGNALSQPYVWGFRTGTVAAVDITRPTVLSTVPVPGATAVAPNAQLSIVLSEAMLPSTVNASTFTLYNTTAGTTVPGSVSYDAASNTAVFTAAAPGTLASNSSFKATLTPAATDLAGNALAGNTAVSPNAGSEVWTFTTAVAADVTRPTAVSTVPAPGATGVATNTQLSVMLSEPMLASTLSTSSFTLFNTTAGTAVAGRVSYNQTSRTAVFTPAVPGILPNNSLFTATLTTAATDLAGNALAGNTAVPPNAGNEVWTFTTGLAGDTTPPTIVTISPADASTLVCLTKPVSATFSEAMDANTISTASLGVTDGGTTVAGNVSYDAASQMASFVPSAVGGFSANHTYNVIVHGGISGVKDLAGNPLANDRTWSFSTGNQACLAPVALGTAGSFGAFGGGAGVTNQGINTVVGGNLGTTAACTLITGFHDAANVYTETPLNIGGVNGSIQCGPPAPGTSQSLAIATQAVNDAQTAYNAMAALPPGSDPGAGELGGLVLSSGVYTSAGGTFAITSGDLTLDARGDAGAVWVFQSASSLTLGLPATPRRVLLINGAQAKNVFWQVGSAARVEDGSTMVGTIIAPAGVTISTAGQTIQSTLIGRAIGLTASVTLVNTTVVAP